MPWYRYIALAVLAILTALMAGVGTWVNVAWSTPASTAGSGTAGSGWGDVGAEAMGVCRPSVESAPTSTWQGSGADSAEAVYQEHADAWSTPYVLGEDGWVFWGDVQANNFSQAIGRRFLSAAELDAWYSYFSVISSKLDELGIPFYIVVAPAKWAVYADDLPSWTDEIRGQTPLDQLIAAHPDLPIIDLRSQLIDARSTAQTYSRVNSHWTDFGGWVAWNAIAGCIQATAPQLGSISAPPIEGATVIGDFNEFADYGIVNPEPDWTAPIYSVPLAPVTVTSVADASTTIQAGADRTQLLSLPVITTNASAASNLRLLFAGDSFGTMLSAPMQQTFSSTYQLRHFIDYLADEQPDFATLVRDYSPDVVIFELTQRHLNLPPTAPGWRSVD